MSGLYIFDADGTLRDTLVAGQSCPHAPGEWRLRPGVRERLSAFLPGDARLGIASNQDHVGYGHLTAELAHGMLVELLVSATGRRVSPAAVQLCPHRLDETCGCRKPAPAMLLRIMRHYGIAPSRTTFVGDAATDREAACRAGMTFLWARELFSA
jgi:D-glycero-D-manno-heptose 1,7-bisphosphate phosphatase